MKFFGIATQKLFDRKSEYRDITLLRIIFLIPETNETLIASPTKFFGTVEQKKLRWKTLLLSNLSYPYTFPLPEFFWNTAQKCSGTNYLGTARQTNFDGKLWFPPTLLPLTVFDTRNQWNTEKHPSEISRHCATSIFGLRISILLRFPIRRFLCYRKISEKQHRRLPLRTLSVLREKNVRQKI